MRELRKEKNLTQEEMAETINLSTNGYAKIERGESIPSSENLQKIAHVLGVDMDSLIRKNHIMIVQDEGTGIHHSEVTNFYNSNTERNETELLKVKMDSLELTIREKDKEIEYLKEIIAQKNKETEHLQEIIQLLKQK